MIIASWNIRGFNSPLKQNGMSNLIHKNGIDVIGILETKSNQDVVNRFVRYKLPNWMEANNFDLADNGRIVVLWNPTKVSITIEEFHPQVIHCLVTCKTRAVTFRVSFVYAFTNLVKRRTLWENLRVSHSRSALPWILMGDFNNVLFAEEKRNGTEVTPYDIKDFSDVCLELGLADANSIGCYFTWSNNHVLEKIDRAMVNGQWDDAGLYLLANFLPMGCLSDHSPCICSVLAPQRRGKTSFRFYDMWTEHQDYDRLVENAWNGQIAGTKQFVLSRKLKHVKLLLKELNLVHFGDISARAKEANAHLTQVQTQLQTDPSNISLLNSLVELRKKATDLSKAEQSFFRQKAKTKFLLNSDRCTKYFHSVVKRNYKRNFIAAISMEDGSVSESLEQVANAFVEFYKTLLGSRCVVLSPDQQVFELGPQLNDEQRSTLLSVVSPEEIKAAIFDIGEDRSPGPDGFSSRFFKKSWNTIGESVVEAVSEFFTTGKILKQLNHTTIVLIPKSNHANSVGDFRPIACGNVIYKAIAKVLAAKIAALLDFIVDKAQAAFIPGRAMSDNIFLMQELIRGYSRKRVSPRCIIKIDLRKAYDTISWDFLRHVLIGFGFPDEFVGLIMECVSTPSYSISVNGNLEGFFKGRRGLRQGDPMSPYLFVLCLEYLSRLIKRDTSDSDFNFHPRCGQLKITHLAFADDVMLLSRGDAPSVKILMDCLKEFGACSGLHLNVLKSNIYTAGMSEDLKLFIQNFSHLQEGTLPFKYLGIPLAASKLKVLHFSAFQERISDYIRGWDRAPLSHAGRIELIRSVIQGVQCFWLGIFPLPSSVRNIIVSLCRNFLWGSSSAPIAWKQICLPKMEGGLGLRDLDAWNSALLSRILWNIQAKKDSLWIRWVNETYLGNASIWDWSTHSRDSCLFKQLEAIRDKILLASGDPGAAECKLNSWHDVFLGTRNKMAYEFFRPTGTHKPWANVIWSSGIMPKQSFTLWVGALRRLKTKERLHHSVEDLTCAFCQAPLETQQHLFFECTFSNSVWTDIRCWIGIHRAMSTLDSALKWLKKEAKGTSKRAKAKKVALASCVHNIWAARNRLIFEKEKPKPSSLVRKVKEDVFRFLFETSPPDLENIDFVF